MKVNPVVSSIQILDFLMLGEDVDALSQAEPDPFGAVISFRASERAKMLATMSELIEGAQKRAKSHNTLSQEIPKWSNLTGKLIWYRDQILRRMNYEAPWRDVQPLKETLEAKEKERYKIPQRPVEKPPWAKEKPV